MVFMSNQKNPKLGKSKVTMIDKGTGQKAMFGFEWGVYFWRLPDGHLLKDEEGRMLSINSVKGDVSNIIEIQRAAAYYGFPEGEPWFYAGISKVTDEEYAEQMDRLKNGLIPSMNDFGAVAAAKKTLETYGDEE
jgi:hypothetical protein